MTTVNELISGIISLVTSCMFLNFLSVKWFKSYQFYLTYVILVIVLDVHMVKLNISLDVFEGISVGLLFGLYIIGVRKLRGPCTGIEYLY